MILLLLFAFTFLAMFNLPLAQPLHRVSFAYFLLGLTWFLVTIAPFLLYKAVHLPPYVLLIPSVGLGIALYGVLWPCLSLFFGRFAPKIIKVIFFVIMIIFPFQQYGYFFGLKEELAFWENIHQRVDEVKSTLLIPGKVIILDDVLIKHNSHIFWLEEAIGKRYFCNLLGDKYLQLHVMHDANKHQITLNFPENHIND
jgi:hypothetical protein